jgi:putative drug exporter of the RND superfamily
VLVPATMELIGDANWWFPKWLDRIIPKIRVESDTEVPIDLPVDLDRPEEKAGAERL